MRIAFVTETWRPHVDGVITRLEATITRLVARGHQVLVIAPTRGAELAGVRQEVIRHALIPIIDRRRPWALPDRRITALIQAFDPDVVHLVSPVLMGVVASRRLAGRYPVVSSFHTDLSAYASRYGLTWTRPLLDRMTKITYQQADVRLATSPTGRRRLGEVGVDESTIMIWPPAVGDGYFESAPLGEISDQQGISVLCVGRLAREKGCDRLVSAARAGGQDWRLTFVGDGPDRARLERLFASTPTTFAGVRHGAELIMTYRQADVIVFPSDTETVGLVLLEAAALGRPVVAVDTPASRDALSGYPRAVFVPVGAGGSAWLMAIRRAIDTAPVLSGGVAPPRPRSWDDATEDLLRAYDVALSRFGVCAGSLVSP